ncbi:recombinase family protein [Streptomyces sp. NPDC004059]
MNVSFSAASSSDAPPRTAALKEFRLSLSAPPASTPLNGAGIPCPAAVDPGRNPHREGQRWVLNTVRAILANPRYTGRQVWNRQLTAARRLRTGLRTCCPGTPSPGPGCGPCGGIGRPSP